MSKVLVLYYSSYGHIKAMANAVAEGARQAGAHVDIKRAPELVPEEVGRRSHYKLDQAAPIAKVEDLAAYDAIVIGAGTRFGRLPSQMANFLDQAGGLWVRGALHGKIGGRRPPRNMAGISSSWTMPGRRTFHARKRRVALASAPTAAGLFIPERPADAFYSEGGLL